MGTLKQMTAAYAELMQAHKKYRRAIFKAQNVGLLKSPANFDDGYFIHFNNLESRVDKLTVEPLARSLQSHIYRQVNK